MASTVTLKPTADPIQFTIDFEDQDRLSWRKILLYRYYQDLGALDELLVRWTDYDSNSEEITLSSEHHNHLISKIQKKDLFKTIIRITTGRLKLMTITLFYTTCTLLIQGHACRSWIASEYQRLLSCLNLIHTQSNPRLEPIFTNSYPTSSPEDPLNSANPDLNLMSTTDQRSPTTSHNQDPSTSPSPPEPIISSPPDSPLNSSFRSNGNSLEVNSLNASWHEDPDCYDCNIVDDLQKELQNNADIIQELKSEKQDLYKKLQSKDLQVAKLQEEINHLKKALEEKSRESTSKPDHRPAKKARNPQDPTPKKADKRDSIDKRSTTSTGPTQKSTTPKTSPTTIILGDSHARHLAEKMKNTVASVNPNRPAEHFDTSIVREYDQVILLAGSNNIPLQDTAEEIDEKISTTITSIKSVNPACKLYIQSILPRYDIVRSRKIYRVNSLLKTTCDLHNATLMPTPPLSREDFTRHGLHLNNSGKTKLARSFTNFLYNTSPPITAPSQPSSFLCTQV